MAWFQTWWFKIILLELCHHFNNIHKDSNKLNTTMKISKCQINQWISNQMKYCLNFMMVQFKWIRNYLNLMKTETLPNILILIPSIWTRNSAITKLVTLQEISLARCYDRAFLLFLSTIGKIMICNRAYILWRVGNI